MLSEEALEKVVDRISKRIEQGNTQVLIRIGRSIRRLKALTPSQAQELVNMIKFGGDYDKMVKYLAKISRTNVKDIEKVFNDIAKTEYNSYKELYKYRNIKFEPYETSYLKTQVDALARITKKEYVNLTKTTNIGFGVVDNNGNVYYKGLKDAYYDVLDKAVINVAQGKRTFDDVMYKSIKAIGNGGLKVIYPSTYKRKDGKVIHNIMRVDSAVRMHLRASIRNLHNETQRIIAKEIDADGMEIMPHEFPAPDHAEVQGRQFSTKPKNKHGISEWDKLQRYGRAKDVKGNTYDIHPILKSGKTSKSFRPISTNNCYHEAMCIIIGVDEPQYTDKELKEIVKTNDKGFEFEGKKYTMYQGAQLQRRLELEIRKAKELHVFGQKTGQQDIINQAKSRITRIRTKYNALCKASGLPFEVERMKVMGYNPRIDLKKSK